MSKRLVTAAVAGSVLLGAPAYATGRLVDQPAAHAGENHKYADTDWRMRTARPPARPRIFMAGDSVTWWDYAELHTMHPSWEISSVPGRDVNTLPYYLRDRMQAKRPPRRVVIALGTNASPGWKYSDLRAAVNLLPRKTKVIFVTPWRDPVRYPNTVSYRARASVAAAYAEWERRIASLRLHTCVADWAKFAERWPTATDDGIHPSATKGRDPWARIVSAVVTGCR